LGRAFELVAFFQNTIIAIEPCLIPIWTDHGQNPNGFFGAVAQGEGEELQALLGHGLEAVADSLMHHTRLNAVRRGRLVGLPVFLDGEVIRGDPRLALEFPLFSATCNLNQGSGSERCLDTVEKASARLDCQAWDQVSILWLRSP